MAEKFSNLGKKIDIQIQESQKTSSNTNLKNPHHDTL